ncbi:MAG: hypothetical protein OXR67_01220 [Chloroflexota bacterium]|nr:hypothetical protein [Chloroflexota bacterium]
MAVWVMRGGGITSQEDTFIRSGSIGIYFGVDGDARRLDGDLRQEIEEFYLWWKPVQAHNMSPASLKGVVTKFLNQTKLFRDGPEIGDGVIMPRKASGGHTVRRGTVDSGYQFRDGADYPHIRTVIWETTDRPRASVPYLWTPSDQRTIIKVG